MTSKSFGLALAAVLAFGASAPLTFAADPPCTTGVGSPLIVDVTQHITGDVDSGFHGNWALDTYDRHLQVWLDTDRITYCARADYNGTFHAPAGVLSPGGGSPITNAIDGTMIGGYTKAITGGTPTTTPVVIPTSLDYGGTLSNILTWTQTSIPLAYNYGASANWLDAVFNPGYSAAFINAGNGWSWDYTSNGTGTHASWTNAGTGSVGDVAPFVDTNTGTGYFSLQTAINSSTDGDTIAFATDATTTTQINVTKAVTIEGNGHTLHATGSKVDNSNNSAIGITNPNVTIKDLIIDGAGSSQVSPTQLHGVNVYEVTGVNLNNVTISHFGGAAVVVNGSDVTATNLNTSNNVWGSVNVDPGSGVTLPSSFNLVSGTLGDNTQIWSDGSHVTGPATVTVTASGYTMYKVAGTTAFFVWSNHAPKGATIGSTLYSTIAAAITAATSGDTINVGPGTYAENITIGNALTLNGAGQGSTTIYPATSNPTGTNNVITIQSDNVTLQNFTIDGNNPNLTSGVVVGGADIDANRGIMTDPNQNHTNLTVNNVTVKNVYLRGIQLGISSQTMPFAFSITNNTVQNVQGDVNSSVAIFNAGGSGTISGNTVSGTPDAINANHSRGTQFLNNTITDSASGIHTDNAGDRSGTTDLIQGNHINDGAGNGVGTPSGSMGIWVFAPYVPVTVNNNVITNVTNGLAAFGQGAAVSTSFTNNTVDLGNLSGSHGAFVTTDQLSFGTQDVSATFTNNTITNAVTGFYVENPGTNTAMIVAHSNSVQNYTTAFNNTSTSTQNITNNWWGTASSTVFAAHISGPVNYTPWYIDSGLSALNTDVNDSTITVSGNFTPSETIDGTATLPSGTSDLAMSNDSVLDLSASANTKVGNDVVIGGATTTLTTFTSGDLVGVDLVTTPPTVGGTSVTIDKAVQLSSGTTSPIVITNTVVSNVTASIPDDTTILAPAGWDGTIAPPKAATGSGDAPSGFSVGSNVIDVGASNAVLLFDKPVTLILGGITGPVGYKPAGSNTWTQITASCGDYDNPTSPTFPGECAVSNGTDTKILTYHFTTFGSLTLLPVGGGAGGSNGGSSSVSSGGGGSIAVAATPAVPTVSPATPATPATPVTPAQGQVLGAQAYKFTKALTVGVRGADVTALQQYLTDNGFYTGPVTGYFGALTRTAVIAFQKARGIANTGTVGPLTRAELNKGTVGTTTPVVGKTNLTTTQAQAILNLLNSFGADASVVAKVRAALGQ